MSCYANIKLKHCISSASKNHVNSSSMSNTLIIGYDGDCPFCNSYIRMQRFKEMSLKVELKNFRESPDLIETMQSQGRNPNDGMYVNFNGAEYYADEAMTLISGLPSNKNIISLFFKWWFQNKTRAKILYPALRIGRNLALKILRRQQITP